MRTVACSILLLVALSFGVWWWQRDAATPLAPSGGDATMASPSPASAAPWSTPTTPDATLVRSDAIAGEAPFVSEIDGEPVADPVRDGVVVLLLDAARQPVVGRDIQVSWSNGRGSQCDDHGVTDAHGRFATTIGEVASIENITVRDPLAGEWITEQHLMPTATDPRVVLCLLPELHPVQLRVIDQHGRPVPGAAVQVRSDDASTTPREHELHANVEEPIADASGRAPCWLPATRHVLVARADGYLALQERIVRLPRGGCEVTLQLFDERDLRELSIFVRGPDEARRELQVLAHAGAPELAVMPAEGDLPIGRGFWARPLDASDGATRFVVRVPPMALRCEARDRRGRWQGEARVSATETEVAIELTPAAPAAPHAILHCTVLLPDGQPTNDARLHVLRTLDPGGANRQHDRSDTPLEVEAGGTACVSARLDGFAPAITGPIELTPGEHQVVLQLQRAGRIAGHVVHADGRPARVWVKLMRPLGPLRALAPTASELVRPVPDADMIGTDTDGSFAFDDVGPGRHALWAEGRTTPLPARIEASAGQHDVRLVLGDGLEGFAVIRGRVTAADTGAPIAGATVTSNAVDHFDEASTDDDGRYLLTIEPGSATLSAHAVGCARYEAEVTIAAAGDHDHDLVLLPSEPLFVRVRTPDSGIPVVAVRAFDATGRALELIDHEGDCCGDAAYGNANGRAELGGLPFAPLRLQLHTTQGEPLQMTVDVPADTPRDRDLEIVWRPDRR